MLLTKKEHRFVLKSDLNPLNPRLTEKNLGEKRLVFSSKVFEVPNELKPFYERYCTFYTIPKTELAYFLLHNTIIRHNEQRNALIYRSKNLPSGYLCIDLNSVHYTKSKIENLSYKSSPALKLAGSPSYAVMQNTLKEILKKAPFLVKKGSYSFDQRFGEKVPSQCNTMTTLQYLGAVNDSYFSQNTQFFTTKEKISLVEDFVIAYTISVASSKKPDAYTLYKKPLMDKAYIKHPFIDYKTGKKTKTKAKNPKLNEVFAPGISDELNFANRWYKKNLKTEIGYRFFCLRRPFIDNETKGGRLYSKFHSTPEEIRLKIASILNYHQLDLTSSMLAQRYSWEKERVRPNANLDDYSFILKKAYCYFTSNTVKLKEIYENSIPFLRPIVKIPSIALVSTFNEKVVEYLVKDHFEKNGLIYDSELYNQYLIRKNYLVKLGTSVYKDTTLIDIRSKMAKLRKEKLQKYCDKYNFNIKKAPTLKESYFLLNMLPRSIMSHSKEKGNSLYILKAQLAEGNASIKQIKYAIGNNRMPLVCHDSIYSPDVEDLEKFRIQIAEETIKVKYNKYKNSLEKGTGFTLKRSLRKEKKKVKSKKISKKNIGIYIITWKSFLQGIGPPFDTKCFIFMFFTNFLIPIFLIKREYYLLTFC